MGKACAQGDYDGEHHPGHAQLLDPANYAGIESGLTWLGVAGLQASHVWRSGLSQFITHNIN